MRNETKTMNILMEKTREGEKLKWNIKTGYRKKTKKC